MKKFLSVALVMAVLFAGIFIGGGMGTSPAHAAGEPEQREIITETTAPVTEPTIIPTTPEEPDVEEKIEPETTAPVVEETEPVATEPKVEEAPKPAGCDHAWIREYQPETETECGYVSRCCAKCGAFEILETIPPYNKEN